MEREHNDLEIDAAQAEGRPGTALGANPRGFGGAFGRRSPHPALFAPSRAAHLRRLRARRGAKFVRWLAPRQLFAVFVVRRSARRCITDCRLGPVCRAGGITVSAASRPIADGIASLTAYPRS